VRRTLPARLAAGTAVAALALSACGSGDEEGEAGSEQASTGGTIVDPPDASAAADAAAHSDAPAVAGVDLGTADLDPTSDVPTNPLPDLVVDDVRRDTEVNLRNLLPAERPVLLWLWAPH
jgi:hypothetical protein